tara:strand:+ start:771 stop:1043 length:273 start_codon:yes stop_codon:yes gene_type:complete
MASNTNVLGSEVTLPTTTGTATSFSEASIVRLVNTDSSAHVVSVVETQSGTGIGSFTMLAGSVEFLEKTYTHCVFASNAAVKGSKVGFTH